jgi:ubiquinol-cytochrome c reductase cytochrome c subunit
MAGEDPQAARPRPDAIGGCHLKLRNLGGLCALLAVVAGGVLAFALAGGTSAAGESPGTATGAAGGTTVAAQPAGQGRELYLQSCASCHGPDGRGTKDGPDITSAGAAGADFMLSTGRMPLSGPGQPSYRQQPAFDDPEIKALVGYVSSLGSGPQIPQVTSSADLHRGLELYVQNCAACHGVAGAGGAIGGGYVAPSLDRATPTQIAEAMIIGPGAMPVFAYSEKDRDAIVAYVGSLRSAPAPGGLSLAGLGPVPEGFVAVVIGVGLLILIVRRIEPPGRKDRATHGAGGDSGSPASPPE